MNVKSVLAMAMTALQQAVTGKDNLTVDAVRVALLAAVVAATGFSAYDLIALQHAFNCLTYGGGVSAIVGGGGLAIWAKSKDEPGA